MLSLRNLPWKQYRIFLLLFLALYGYVFVPIPDSDSTRYIENFRIYSSYSLSDIETVLTNTYTDNTLNPDIYAPVLLFLVTRFTDNYRIFFLIVSLVYFSVAFKLWETIWDFAGGQRFKLYSVFFLGTFFLLGFSAGINGVRWPLGFMVFSLGSLKFILTSKMKYFILAGLSLFIHYALIYPLLFLLLFLILQLARNLNIIMIGLITVLFLTSILSQFISSNAGLFGPAIQGRLMGFTGEGFLESRTSIQFVWNWYILVNLYATQYFLFFALFMIFLRRSALKFDDLAVRLLMFVILVLIQSILSGNILDPLTNSRYYLIMFLFGLITLLYLGKINPSSVLLRNLSYIYIPVMVLRALIIIRTDLYTVSPLLIFGNIFSIFSPKSEINIYDFII